MTVKSSRASHSVLILVVTCGLAACSSEPVDTAATSSTPAPAVSKELDQATAKVFETAESHADAPPHGGVIIELGNHTAHAEVVMVPDDGEVTVHILDAQGQPGKRVAQPTILADVETSGRMVRIELKANPLEGERVGDASRFSARSEELLRVSDARVTIRWVLVDGQVFSDNVVALGQT